MKRAEERQISRAVRHMAVICVMTASLTALLLLAGCGRSSAAVEIGTQSSVPFESETAPAEAPETETALAQTQPPAEEPGIFVHVCGQVLRPGVYDLPAGSRVWDAVEEAGGFLEEAAADSVNLAAALTDGMKVVIPSQEEAAQDPYGLAEEGWYQEAQTSEDAETSDGQAGLVDINRATAAQLQTVPGIGEVRARDIVAYRETHGLFEKVEDIMQVSGIKEGLFAKIKDYITVGG